MTSIFISLLLYLRMKHSSQGLPSPVKNRPFTVRNQLRPVPGETLNKKDLSLTAQKWQSVQENKKIKVQTLPDDPPSVKRSQSFQSTKSDEKDIRIKELEKQLAKAKGKSCELPILLHIGGLP